MKDKLYRVKGLVWKKRRSGGWFARTIVGTYRAWTWRGDGRSRCELIDKDRCSILWYAGMRRFLSLDAAKAACEAHWRERIAAALEEVTP